MGLLIISISSVLAQQNPFDIQGRSNTPKTNIQDTLAVDTVAALVEPPMQVKADSNELLASADSLASQEVNASSILDTIDSTAINPFEQDSPASVIDHPDSIAVAPPEEPMINESEGKDSAALLEGLKELSEHLPQIEIDKNQNVLFIITVLILLFLATLLAVNRSMINKSYRAIANDNFLRFLFREYKSMPWLYWIFYIYFFVNGGLFLYLMANYFNWLDGHLSLLILCIVIVAVLYIVKQFSLQVLAGSFPVEKETQLYGFVTMLINILLGVVLTPINLVGAFAPEPFVQWAIWVGIGSFVGLYFFRQLKGLFIAGRFLHSYKFHFFIYLCTAEIAPLLIIGKLAFDKVGI